MLLTEKKIAKLHLPGRHSDGRNLYLNISKNGAKSWVFIYRDPVQRAVNKKTGKSVGKIRELGLGSFTGEGSLIALDLEAARLAADRVRIQIADGVDPIAAKKAARQGSLLTTKTFADYVKDLMVQRAARWTDGTEKKRSTAEAWQNTYDKHCASFMKSPINDVTDEVIVALLKNLYHNVSMKLCETVRTRIFYVMEIACAEKVNGVHVYQHKNPARYEGHISVLVGDRNAKAATANEANRAALDAKDAPALMTLLMREQSNTAKALAFTILTGVRSNETISAQWSEIDFDKAHWVIPAERMKMRKDHVVPLSTVAINLLRSIPQIEGNPFVFTGNRSGQSIGVTSMGDMLCKPVADGGFGYRGKATVHGMRSMFRSWAGQQKRWTEKACELAIAHVYGSKVQRAYDRYDEIEARTEMMQAWADFLRPAAELKAVA